MDRVPLYEEFRLIERKENEINGAWKGVHLLLFFLAFVFGSFCTFCFHMLMYLFDEKCVLFPKLLSLTSSRHNVIYEFIPEEKQGEESPALPVDFLSTQWVEKSACYLPTFVPLVSGIFGLVWTTMFLMCSTGSRTLTGETISHYTDIDNTVVSLGARAHSLGSISLQRPWRVLPPVFVFSLAMGTLCIYSSSVTHYGLKQLCIKLGEITGTSTCSYTVNVATLAYERRIRGVYQATWLTIISAWVHTFCWLLSAFVALLRILLAVDFQLVRISVHLIGDVDKLLESREEQIRTVCPLSGLSRENSVSFDDDENTIFHYRSKSVERLDSTNRRTLNQTDSLNYADDEQMGHLTISELSLVPEERDKLARLEAFEAVTKSNHFIVDLLYDMLNLIEYDSSSIPKSSSLVNLKTISMENLLAVGSEQGTLLSSSWDTDAELVARKKQFQAIPHELEQSLSNTLQEIKGSSMSFQTSTTLVAKQENFKDVVDTEKANGRGHVGSESSLMSEMRNILDTHLNKALIVAEVCSKHKSSLKSRVIETDKRHKTKKNRKVQIIDSNRTVNESPTTSDSDSEQGSYTNNTETSETQEKQTQTKEKED